MKYVVCLPFVHKAYAEACLKTCKFPKENMLLVDNTSTNIGVMKSHNLGVARVLEEQADWLVILSAAIRFGKPGGLDFIAELEKRPDHKVLEAAKVFGWHLIAFRREVLETVGKWDENFTPYGYDDLDYSWRIQVAYSHPLGQQVWEKVPVDAKDMGMAHSIKLSHVTTNNEKLRIYYRKKWGIMPEGDHAKAHRTPFNEDHPISYWPRVKHG